MRNLLSKVDNFFLRQNKGTVIAVTMILAVLLGFLDYITGFELTFSFFYLIPIAFATWYFNVQAGYITTGISIVVWLVSNGLAGQTYSNEFVQFWNASIRMIVFILITALLNELKLVIEHERILSRTDFLTGIYNSREFYRTTEMELQRARRYKHPITIAYIDLDNFKQVNDQFGHSEGDKLLRTITKTISSVTRKNDIFARLGGDEFGLLLPETDRQGAEKAVQKAQNALMANMRENKIQITFSIGVISYISAPKSIDELLQKADELMYKAKSQGDNKSLFVQID